MIPAVATLPISREVLDFAAEQGVAEYLPVVLEMTARVFPGGLKEVIIEDDPEIANDRHILAVVHATGLGVPRGLEAQSKWVRGLFECCPAPKVCVFRLDGRRCPVCTPPNRRSSIDIVMQPRRLGILATFALVLCPFLFAADPPAGKPQFYKGKVLPLADRLAKSGIRLDRDAAPLSLALLAEDGKVYPLLKDEGSRMFYLDARLLNRPMRLTGRTFADTRLLQVLQVHSLLKGELHEVYYWCDICAIKRFEKRQCECCGGPMELREIPVKK